MLNSYLRLLALFWTAQIQKIFITAVVQLDSTAPPQGLANHFCKGKSQQSLFQLLNFVGKQHGLYVNKSVWLLKYNLIYNTFIYTNRWAVVRWVLLYMTWSLLISLLHLILFFLSLILLQTPWPPFCSCFQNMPGTNFPQDLHICFSTYLYIQFF